MSSSSLPRIGDTSQGVDTPRVDLTHGLREPVGQIMSRQMHVLPGRLQILVTGKTGNLVQLPARAGEIGQTKMAERMGRERWNIGTKRNGSDYCRASFKMRGARQSG
jgi:hypothetical protein